jgi:hypothetical protein
MAETGTGSGTIYYVNRKGSICKTGRLTSKDVGDIADTFSGAEPACDPGCASCFLHKRWNSEYNSLIRKGIVLYSSN